MDDEFLRKQVWSQGLQRTHNGEALTFGSRVVFLGCVTTNRLVSVIHRCGFEILLTQLGMHLRRNPKIVGGHGSKASELVLK